jgi:P27 family predicted phage terminase small subunit
MIGRPPLPTSVKVLRGTIERSRLNPNEPKPPLLGRSPVIPPEVRADPRALLAWRQIVPQLRKLHLLTTVDVHALSRYAIAVARWQQAEAVLQAEGLVYPVLDRKGRPKCWRARPEVAISRDYMRLAGTIAAEFGLTPATRSRIHTVAPQLEKNSFWTR